MGDVVRVKTSSTLGVVVDINEGTWPKDWDLTDPQKSWEMKLGRRIDVLWSSGELTKNFAEHALEVVNKQEKKWT